MLDLIFSHPFVSRWPSCPTAQNFARAFMVPFGTLAGKDCVLANLVMTPCILIAVFQHRDAAKSAPKKAPDACSLVPTDRKRYQLPPGARGLAMRATVSVYLISIGCGSASLKRARAVPTPPSSHPFFLSFVPPFIGAGP